VLAITLVLVLAISFMVGMLFWQQKGAQSLIYTALNSANEDFKRASLMHILWQKGLEDMKQTGFFPHEIVLKIEGSPAITAKLVVSRESSRLNVNKASEEELLNLFLEHGISREEAHIMVDSLLDWRDKDNLHRLNGAEKDYYLPYGYSPANGPFKDLSEIALVRGFNPYRFWFTPGIYQWITIYTETTKNAIEDEDITLRDDNVYRLELYWKEGDKSFKYLEIFRYKNGKRNSLFNFTF